MQALPHLDEAATGEQELRKAACGQALCDTISIRKRACALDQPRSASGPSRGQELGGAGGVCFAAATRPARGPASTFNAAGGARAVLAMACVLYGMGAVLAMAWVLC